MLPPLLLTLTLACTGTKPLDTGGGDTSGGDDTGWCAVDPMELRLVHRPEAVACPATRTPLAPAAESCATAAGSTCTSHEDCTGGANGRCVRDPETPDCSCHYDDCSQDADCGDSRICACAEAAPYEALVNNQCQTASCLVDGDCGTGLCIAGTFSCGVVDAEQPVLTYGLSCASPQDECRNDESCWCDDPWSRCIDVGGHRACSDDYAATCD